MDYKELLEKYNILLEEVKRLTKENSLLKAQLGLMKSELSRNTSFSTFRWCALMSASVAVGGIWVSLLFLRLGL